MPRIGLALTVLGTVLYHVTQKLTPRGVNPFVSLGVTYLVALGACLTLLLASGGVGGGSRTLASLNWASAGCGVAIFLVEIGVLLSYRADWDIKALSLVSNTIVALALVPIGVFWFREALEPRSVLGLVLCIGGLLLLRP